MAGSPARRSPPALPALLLALAGCLLASLLASPARDKAFLSASPLVRGRTAMHGFKEDFEAWRSTLTPEERKLVTKQAQKEFNKNFRKSDEFKQDLPDEKIEAFSKVLGKFFESEAEDYKKDLETKVPDYEGLTRKAKGKKFDFSLTSSIEEVDREADRRYRWAINRLQEAQQKGETWPKSSKKHVTVHFQNNDTESHNRLVGIIDSFKKFSQEASYTDEQKAAFNYWIEKGVPPIGEELALLVPEVMTEHFNDMDYQLTKEWERIKKNSTEAEASKWYNEVLPKLRYERITKEYEGWVKASDQVEKDAQNMKAFFRSQYDSPGRTKADVLKEMWKVLPQVLGEPVPPLDDELVAEFANKPAVVPGDDFRHSWGIADKLYKSEAIDAFGQKYLLGVFEDKADAQKAFDEWNAEYERARKEMDKDLQQFSKQEQARSDRDTTGADRIKKVLEESRR